MFSLEILLRSVEKQIFKSKIELEKNLEQYRKSYNEIISSFDVDLGYKMPTFLDIELKGHPDYTYRVKTGALIFTDIGFRDDGLDKEPYAIAIGDSFVWGYGVNGNEIWTEILEGKLNKDIVNLAMPGFSVMQYYYLLRKYGLKFTLSVVFIGYYTGNDYNDSLAFKEWKDARTDLSLPAYFMRKENRRDALRQKGFRKRLSKFLQRNSIIYKLLREVDIKRAFDPKQKTIVTKKGDLIFSATNEISDRWKESYKEDFKNGWELTKEYLDKIKDLCSKEGVVLYLLLIPSKEEVYCDYIAEKFSLNKGEKNNILYNYIAIKEFCKDEGIAYIDLLPEFRKCANRGEKAVFYIRWTLE